MIQASLQISGERLVFSINGAEAIKYLYEGKKSKKEPRALPQIICKKVIQVNHMQKK